MTFEEELAGTGRLVYTNKGVSMMPLLRQGKDIMVMEACTASQVRKLDAVLFVREKKMPSEAERKPSPVEAGQARAGEFPSEAEQAQKGRRDYVLHRVLRINPDGTFWIMGDNCLTGETVAGDRIIGRLTAVIRDGKTISMQKPGLAYLCYLYLWCRPYHLRIFLLRGKNFAKRCLRFVRRRIQR